MQERDGLREDLARVREEMGLGQRQLEDELEEALGELGALEEQEQRREEQEQGREEALQTLQQEKADLERELGEARAQLIRSESNRFLTRVLKKCDIGLSSLLTNGVLTATVFCVIGFSAPVRVWFPSPRMNRDRKSVV